MHKILFVCMGNICRSPMAEGIFRKLVVNARLEIQFEIDSAGTGDWHLGNPPDQRAQEKASQRGVDLSSLRARQISPEDILYYDAIIAMDKDNLDRLKTIAPENHKHKIRLLLEYGDSPQLEVPDPYYGSDHGFDLVFDMIEEACQALLGELTHR